MKALTIRQPWAGLLASGRKSLEARKVRASYRGPLLLHAGLTVDEGAMAAVRLCAEQGEIPPDLLSLCEQLGAVVGVADLVGCRPWRTDSLVQLRADLDAQEGQIFELPTSDSEARAVVRRKSPWLWELQSARVLRRTVAVPGRRGIWIPPPDLVRACGL